MKELTAERRNEAAALWNLLKLAKSEDEAIEGIGYFINGIVDARPSFKTAQELCRIVDKYSLTLPQLKEHLDRMIQSALAERTEQCAKICIDLITSGENKVQWTITRDLCLREAATQIRALNTENKS